MSFTWITHDEDDCTSVTSETPSLDCRNVTPGQSLSGRIADMAVMSGLSVAIVAADIDPRALALLLLPFALTYFIARRIERNSRRG